MTQLILRFFPANGFDSHDLWGDPSDMSKFCEILCGHYWQSSQIMGSPVHNG